MDRRQSEKKKIPGAPWQAQPWVALEITELVPALKLPVYTILAKYYFISHLCYYDIIKYIFGVLHFLTYNS